MSAITGTEICVCPYWHQLNVECEHDLTGCCTGSGTCESIEVDTNGDGTIDFTMNNDGTWIDPSGNVHEASDPLPVTECPTAPPGEDNCIYRATVELNPEMLFNEFDRPVDNVTITEPMVIADGYCNDLAIFDSVTGKITATGDVLTRIQITGLELTITGASGSSIDSQGFDITFYQKHGNVILAGSTATIQGTIENSLTISIGCVATLSGDLTVQRLLNQGTIERNGFTITITG